MKNIMRYCMTKEKYSTLAYDFHNIFKSTKSFMFVCEQQAVYFAYLFTWEQVYYFQSVGS